mmetsp:Transcript_61502/g.159694  ORF Transcript_61502/g.159694 Transcript_61502/m.159694 type:complete len:252 (-) Transcript_61502:183-938(-)
MFRPCERPRETSNSEHLCSSKFQNKQVPDNSSAIARATSVVYSSATCGSQPSLSKYMPWGAVTSRGRSPIRLSCQRGELLSPLANNSRNSSMSSKSSVSAPSSSASASPLSSSATAHRHRRTSSTSAGSSFALSAALVPRLALAGLTSLPRSPHAVSLDASKRRLTKAASRGGGSSFCSTRSTASFSGCLCDNFSAQRPQATLAPLSALLAFALAAEASPRSVAAAGTTAWSRVATVRDATAAAASPAERP